MRPLPLNIQDREDGRAGLSTNHPGSAESPAVKDLGGIAEEPHDLGRVLAHARKGECCVALLAARPKLADAHHVRIVLISMHEPQLTAGRFRDERGGMQQPLRERLTVVGTGVEGRCASQWGALGHRATLRPARCGVLEESA
jgi:hypothetical protein